MILIITNVYYWLIIVSLPDNTERNLFTVWCTVVIFSFSVPCPFGIFHIYSKITLSGAYLVLYASKTSRFNLQYAKCTNVAGWKEAWSIFHYASEFAAKKPRSAVHLLSWVLEVWSTECSFCNVSESFCLWFKIYDLKFNLFSAFIWFHYYCN